MEEFGFKVLRGTYEDWQTYLVKYEEEHGEPYIPEEGKLVAVGFEDEQTGEIFFKLKIGNGNTEFNDLPYTDKIDDSGMTIDEIVEALDTKQDKLNAGEGIIIETSTGPNMFNIEDSFKSVLTPIGTTEENQDYITSNYIKVKANTTYVISNNYREFKEIAVALYDTNKHFIEYKSNTGTAVNNSFQYYRFNTTQDGYLRFTVYGTNTKIMLNKGTTYLPYEDYVEIENTISATGGGGPTGDIDYHTQVTNKPTINNVEIDGDLTSEDLGVVDESVLPTLASKSQVDDTFENMGDVEFNHSEEGIIDVEKDGNSWYLTSSSSAWYGELKFTKGIPAIEENLEIEIDFDSVDTTGTYVIVLVGNDLNDLSTSIFYGQLGNYSYDLQQDKIILDLSSYRNIIGSYDYMFLSLSSGPYSLGFNNPTIKYKEYGTILVKKTINDDYYTEDDVDKLLSTFATKEDLSKENEWETVGSVNKGMSGTSTLLDFSDISIPTNNPYRAWRVLYYVNATSSGIVEIFFNGSSSGNFWFGYNSTVSGKKFTEIIIEGDVWTNIDGSGRSMYGTATLNRCNTYNYGQRTNFLATSGNYIDIPNITSIKVNIGTDWTFDNSGGATVILQGRR